MVSDEPKAPNFNNDAPLTCAVTGLGIAIKCVRCEYDLRGSELDGRCPECGLAVKVSAARETLAILEPSWIGNLAAGAKTVSFVGRYLWPIVWPIIYLLERGGYWPKSLAACLFGILILIVGYGVWIFSTPPILRSISRGVMNAGRIAFWMVGVVSVGAVVCVALIIADAPISLIAASAMIGSPFGLAGAIGGVSFGVYCKNIAKLFFEDFVVVRAQNYTVIFIVGCLLTLPSIIVFLATGANWPLFMLLPGGCCMLGGGILILAIPSYLDKRLQELRSDADRTWREYEIAHELSTGEVRSI